MRVEDGDELLKALGNFCFGRFAVVFGIILLFGVILLVIILIILGLFLVELCLYAVGEVLVFDLFAPELVARCRGGRPGLVFAFPQVGLITR